jgi:hypothetical protein
MISPIPLPLPLHVYAQDAWHDDAQIIGTPESLRALAAALMRAADTGHTRLSGCMAGDGEGYDVEIVTVTEDVLDTLPVPYTWEHAREQDGDKWERLAELLREARKRARTEVTG